MISADGGIDLMVGMWNVEGNGCSDRIYKLFNNNNWHYYKLYIVNR